MCNAVKLFVSEDICGDIADISADKVCTLGNKVGVSRREIVNNGDGMALFKQHFGDGAANVSCAACYENLHTVLHLSYVVVSLSLFICIYGAPSFHATCHWLGLCVRSLQGNGASRRRRVPCGVGP